MADAPATQREIERMLDKTIREIKEDARRNFKDLEDKFLYRWNIDEMEEMFQSLERKMDTIEKKIDQISQKLGQN